MIRNTQGGAAAREAGRSVGLSPDQTSAALAALGRPDTVSDGNAILGHILGSTDVSRAVATRAAGQFFGGR